MDYKYFPPITIKPFGNKSVDGTGFGVFATSLIVPNVFICEYATDLVNGSQARFIKRNDMQYSLYHDEHPSKSLILGPIKFCGYGPLINDLGRKRNNCKSVIAIVEQRIRVLIYTFK